MWPDRVWPELVFQCFCQFGPIVGVLLCLWLLCKICGHVPHVWVFNILGCVQHSWAPALRWTAEISHLFPSPTANFVLSSLLGGLLVELWPRFKDMDKLKSALGLPGVIVPPGLAQNDPQRTQNVGWTSALNRGHK